MENFNLFVEKINENDALGLQELIKIHSATVDIEDNQGMTLLQHAAFKGKHDLCQLLLDLGADPNGGHHEHKYTALHFGALSGNVDVCQLLLDHGAKLDAINSVGRTAPQMAAFVGNHHCVSVMNNFIPLEDIQKYTVSHDKGCEPKLPPAVCPALHKLVMQVNLHPIHLLIVISKMPLILEHVSKIKNVLELLCEKQMKCGKEANEILSLKYHYLNFLVTGLLKFHQQNNEQNSSDVINLYAKKFLKIRPSDGYPEFLDNFVREAIRTFSYKETTIFRQLLVNLSRTKQNFDSPTALNMLSSSINGQRGFQEENCCSTCGEEKVSRKCSNCKAVQYCDRDCQKLHWSIHKKECESLALKFKDLQLETSNAKPLPN